jgi:heptosyltransferase-2
LGFFAPTSSAEIGVFNTGVKVESLSNDYCSYRPDADNSTITAKRILDAFNKHIASI